MSKRKARRTVITESRVDLEKERCRIVQAIVDRLDLLIGTVNKSPAQPGYTLTWKDEQKTRTRYVRVGIIEEATKMTDNYLEARKLMRDLSEVNWKLLILKSEGR